MNPPAIYKSITQIGAIGIALWQASEAIIACVSGFLGILSFFAMGLGHLFYIQSTRAGKTIPNKMFWIIVFVNAGIVVANQIALGINNTLWGMILIQISLGTVLFFALRKGVARFNRIDFTVAGVALAGVVGWWVTEDPMVSVVMSAVAGLVSIMPIFNKLRSLPGTEDSRSWFLAGVAMMIQAIAVEPKIEFLLLPVTWVGLNLSVLIANELGKRSPLGTG